MLDLLQENVSSMRTETGNIARWWKHSTTVHATMPSKYLLTEFSRLSYLVEIPDYWLVIIHCSVYLRPF